METLWCHYGFWLCVYLPCYNIAYHFPFILFILYTVLAPCLHVRPLRLVKMLHDLGFVFVVAVIVAIILHRMIHTHTLSVSVSIVYSTSWARVVINGIEGAKRASSRSLCVCSYLHLKSALCCVHFAAYRHRTINTINSVKDSKFPFLYSSNNWMQTRYVLPLMSVRAR